MNHEPIPTDFPVKIVPPGTKGEGIATCGHCGLSWDDSIVTDWTPVPSARCPFEPFHVYEDDDEGEGAAGDEVYTRLRDHLGKHSGHEIVIASYNDADGEPINIAVECETCYVVIIDGDVVEDDA
jgi:hypothetical protein